MELLIGGFLFFWLLATLLFAVTAAKVGLRTGPLFVSAGFEGSDLLKPLILFVTSCFNCTPSSSSTSSMVTSSVSRTCIDYSFSLDFFVLEGGATAPLMSLFSYFSTLILLIFFKRSLLSLKCSSSLFIFTKLLLALLSSSS